MNLANFFAELKRRNVSKVAITYAVVAWLLLQAASILLPTFEAPAWVMKALVVFLALGFVISVMISWAFEATPEGLKRTENVPPDAVLPTWSRRKFVAFVAGVAVVAAGLLAFQSLRLTGTDRAGAVAGAEEKEGRSAASLPIPLKSIAVLPFDNLSEEKGNIYFAEGIQDEILTRLAKVADLKVISRTSTQRFKSAPSDLREIAKQLGVANILEGSVQKSNDQVRVNVQLINAQTDAHLWADTYDRKLTDIFAVESEIAKTIAETLQAKLTGSEKILLAKKPTANPEAYELYLKGRFFWNKRTAVDLRKSIDYFNAAIAKDPDYAAAYAALAQAWLLLPAYDGAAPKDCIVPGETATRKALALDETSSEAHTALGLLRSSFQFDYSGAKVEYERAIQLNPNDPTAVHWFASDAGTLGDGEREVTQMRRALELDPLSLVINTNLGQALIHANRLDEAIIQLRKTIEMDGGFQYAHRRLGLALELKGQIPEAMGEYQKAIALSDDPTALAMLGHLYGTIGRKDEATKILGQMQAMSEQRYSDPYAFAIVYLGLGDRQRALASLEQAYNEKNGSAISYIRTDPFLDPLRGDPGFEALAEKIVPAREFAKGAMPSK